MNRDQLPDEDEQYEAYAKVARAMKGKPVVAKKGAQAAAGEAT